MRYHVFPFLIPKEGKVYELRTTMDAKILYFKDETAWTTLLSFLTKPWYRRWVKQDWVSWEIVATKEQIRYYIWVPDVHIGSAFKSKYYSEHPDVEIVEVEDRAVDFSRPHAATRLFMESHWTVPIKTYHNEVVDTQAELIEFLDGLEEGQEVHMQFLVQPAYRTEKSFRGITQQFHRQYEADESLRQDNELYLSAIEGKSTRVLSRMAIKVVAFGKDAPDSKELIRSAKGSIGTFSSGRLNQLKTREWWWFRTIRPLFRWEFKNRIFPMERMKKRLILGSEEMAAMMRLPSERVHSNRINRLKMRPTPLPKELKDVDVDSDLAIPFIDDNFLNGGIVLQRLGEASLPNLQRLLSDPEYREGVLERLDQSIPIERDLYLYFNNLQGLKDRELQAKTNSTLNKLRKITLSGVMGQMLRAKTNGLRFRESMDQGMINLLDLSELTSDEKKLIGSMCLTLAELAGKSRADTPAMERDKLPYHFVMVDEAPTLMEHSTDAIESFASELRKYRVSIILGMQGIKDQLPREVASAIFRNFGTFVSFRLGEPDDAEYVNRSMTSEVLKESDYLQVEPYHAYIRMQVGNERTRPFLIRMKEPGPAHYDGFIPTIKDRTLAEAMLHENQETENEWMTISARVDQNGEEELFVEGTEMDVLGFPLENPFASTEYDAKEGNPYDLDITDKGQIAGESSSGGHLAFDEMAISNQENQEIDLQGDGPNGKSNPEDIDVTNEDVEETGIPEKKKNDEPDDLFV
ncbi:ATPase [Peribacillus sp. NPDC097295]|uniref:ATPase n=1 Tax=Peribacillus sp. NPDC097295 TaxID=3364402 RepID=UPI0038215784